MDNWGGMAQFDAIYWPWPIAVYLFLAGISAGSVMASLVIKWAHHSDGEAPDIWDAMVKAGAVIAPLTIVLGLFLLIFDLGKPFTFYWLLLKFNFDSVMSIGVLLLLIYTPFVAVFMMLVHEATFKKIPVCSGIINFFKNYYSSSKAIEYILFALALGVAVYTGFLLSAIYNLPLWNSPVLPIIFLTSGLSAGIAANILVGLMFFKSTVNPASVKYLLAMDLRVILTEIPLLAMLFIGMYYSGGAAVTAAVQALTVGVWASVFWYGVVGVGLVAPLAIAFTALRNHAYRVGFILFNSFVILSGVVMLRFYIVYAGQLFPGT